MCTSNYIRKHYILLTQTTLATTRNPGLLLLWARNRRRPRVGGEFWHGILWARDTGTTVLIQRSSPGKFRILTVRISIRKDVRGPMSVIRDIWANKDTEEQTRTTYQNVLELREKRVSWHTTSFERPRASNTNGSTEKRR